MNEYLSFLESKKHSSQNYGIKPTFIPDAMFDFQKYVAEYEIKKGRGACFLDTGLGKTFIEIVVAVNYLRHTNKPILILCPLAVAFQFIKEADKFGIDDIEYSKDGKYTKKIIVTNYERLHYFNAIEFDCVICDESGILKNFEGIIKNAITSFLKKVKYRFLFTAVPAPNDFTELGTHSEALGELGYTDMLTKFFTNNEDTISPMNIGTEWILKGHAKENFFKWVSGWSISMRKPSDLGFDDTRFILPELIMNYHEVKNDKPLVIKGQYQMFNIMAKTNDEINAERRLTIDKRCEKAVELSASHEISVYWCNLNPEGDLLQKLDRNAYQIKGTMDIDQKEEILLGFLNGDIKKLITKGKMTAWGLNWQHCNHLTYFPSFSYEIWYQLVRRFWRFGQKRNVYADMIISCGQKRILDSLLAKSEKANELFSKLNSQLHQNFAVKNKEFNKQINLPSWV